MSVMFRNYKARDQSACLSLFDQNCPEFFAPNERDDYLEFLDTNPARYQLCIYDDKVVGAFGVFDDTHDDHRLNWIMLNPEMQGIGLGTMVMNRVLDTAGELEAQNIHIATSQVAYKFFEKFGAEIVKKTENGWGQNMHKYDMIIRL